MVIEETPEHAAERLERECQKHMVRLKRAEGRLLKAAKEMLDAQEALRRISVSLALLDASAQKPGGK